MKSLILTVLIILSAQLQASAQNWWETNSLALDSLSNDLLFRAEGQYSLNIANGTISGFLHEGEGGFKLRRERFLFNAFTDLKYQKVEMGSQVIREKYMLIEGALIYDMLPYLHVEAGTVWERDDQQYIDQRLIMYAGANVELFSKSTWGHPAGFNVMFALGEQRKLYVDTDPVMVNWVGYFQQNFRLLLQDNIIFSEKFIMVHEFGDDGGYRNMLRLQTIFRFTPYVSAMIKHETKYEQKTLFPGIEKLNHFQTVGLRFEI